MTLMKIAMCGSLINSWIASQYASPLSTSRMRMKDGLLCNGISTHLKGGEVIKPVLIVKPVPSSLFLRYCAPRSRSR